MSATDKATIAKTNTDTIVEAHQEGLVSTQTAMKELKQSSGNSGIFTHISDEDIEDAENDEPPLPGSELADPERQGAEAGQLGTGATPPKQKDSIWKRLSKTIKK